MSTRIPSSLLWLIDKRARIDAEIRKTQLSIAKTKGLIKELSSLKKSLLPIDKALALHEISVDISLIEPIKSKYKRIDLPYGELTSSILDCLRIHGGRQHVSKTEIIDFVVSRHPNLMTNAGINPWLFGSVSKRLNGLAKKGVIQRHHPSKTTSEGLWSLASDGEDD